MRCFTIGLLAVLVVAGCKSGGDNQVIAGHESSPSGLPAGWTRVTANSGGVSLGMPSDWHEKPTSGNEIKKGMSAIKSQNSADEEIKKSGAEITSSIKLVIDHGMDAKGLDANATIVVVPSEGGTQEALTKSLVDQFKQIGAVVTSTKNETLAAGESSVVECKRSMTYASGPADLEFTSYLIAKNGKEYLLTFTLPAGNDSLKSEVDGIAKTFQIDK